MPLAADIKRAYLPYMKAFLDDPDQASLKILDDGFLVEGRTLCSTRDFNSIEADPAFRAEQSRTFNRLVRYLAPNREPILTFDKMGG